MPPIIQNTVYIIVHGSEKFSPEDIRNMFVPHSARFRIKIHFQVSVLWSVLMSSNKTCSDYLILFEMRKPRTDNSVYSRGKRSDIHFENIVFSECFFSEGFIDQRPCFFLNIFEETYSKTEFFFFQGIGIVDGKSDRLIGDSENLYALCYFFKVISRIVYLDISSEPDSYEIFCL